LLVISYSHPGLFSLKILYETKKIHNSTATHHGKQQNHDHDHYDLQDYYYDEIIIEGSNCMNTQEM